MKLNKIEVLAGISSFLVTEYISGGSLWDLIITDHSPLYEDQIRLYVAELVVILEYIHKNNCIYRDLKPDNILIDSEGHLKIIDFGLSKILDESKKRATSICGSNEFMAPEIYNDDEYDYMVDWFSLGAIVYYLYSGKLAYDCQGIEENEDKILEIKKKPLTYSNKFPKDAKDLINKLTKFDPKKRLGSKGVKEIKNNEYFKNYDFDMVLNKKYTPLYIPDKNPKLMKKKIVC